MRKHKKEQTVTIRGKNSISISVYQLMVNDATNKIPDEVVEDWFVAFQNGFLEETLNEYKADNKLKRLEFEIDIYGHQAVVNITKRRRWL